MKHLKKLAAVLLTLLMVMSLTTTAFAANVTLPTDAVLSGHTFVAYQIFTGTQNIESGNTLGTPINWGTGIDAAAFLVKLQGDTSFNDAFKDCVEADAAGVVKALSGFASDSALANKIAKYAYESKTGNGTTLVSGSNELADGYYLIVDTGAVDEGEAYNAALLQVTRDITVACKTDAPSIEKKVKENDKYNQNEGYGEGYNDVADYNIGDSVPFAFYSKVPDMTYFDSYTYIIHDEMSDGLTLDKASGSENYNVTVYIGETRLTYGTDFTVALTDKGFDINVQNFIKYADQKDQSIKVDFTATLNKNAEVGLDGNPNEVYLEYSNNPNDNTSKGNTPHDKVIVFTYELDVTKVDGANKETTLEGAEFKLHRGTDDNKEWVVITDGRVSGWTANETNASVLTSDVNGKFSVIGLDDGTYYLKEITAPLGYNVLKDEIELAITATTVNDQNWEMTEEAKDALTAIKITVGTVDKAGNLNTGSVSMSVENNKGNVLPETGGIGTTIFYVLGSLMAVGAAVLLITKKRVSE